MSQYVKPLIETPDGVKIDVNFLPDIDWNAAEGESGHVKNRTHYEETTVVNEPLNITWDGNTDGLVSVGEMYKVSDLVLTDEQIKTVIETISTGETAILSEEWDYLVADGCVTEDVVFGEYATYVRTAGIEIDGATIPEAGIYFMSVDGWAHVSSLTTTEPVPQTKTVVHKLDKKWLPDDISWLPAVTEADNGKVLMVVDGKWQAVTLNLTVDENGVVSM